MLTQKVSSHSTKINSPLRKTLNLKQCKNSDHRVYIENNRRTIDLANKWRQFASSITPKSSNHHQHVWMIKRNNELRSFIPLFGVELTLRRHLVWIHYGDSILTTYRMDFPFLSVVIQKESFITNYKHIYIVTDVKSPRSCSKEII